MSTPQECGRPDCPYDTTLIRDMHAEQAVQRTKIEGIENGVQDIKRSLIGNGKPGLLTRIDRVEQKELLRSRVFWILFGLVSTSLVGYLFAY